MRIWHRPVEPQTVLPSTTKIQNLFHRRMGALRDIPSGAQAFWELVQTQAMRSSGFSIRKSHLLRFSKVNVYS
jgi:hypothetical protein